MSKHGHIFLPHEKVINEVWSDHQNRTLSEARARWELDCPCCGRPMRKPDPPFKPSDSTRGHDIPQASGGAHWLYICRACNDEQRNRSYKQWAKELEANPSTQAFAVRVREVEEFMESMRVRALLSFVERVIGSPSATPRRKPLIQRVLEYFSLSTPTTSTK